MNLLQAQQLLTIVKYMNLSKAASEVYISQPALSLSLGRLEKELGVRLFFRDGNKLILSHDGEVLYDYFRNLNEAHQKLLSKTEELTRPSQEEYITFGFSGSPLQFAALCSTGICDNFQGKHVKIVSADTRCELSRTF